MFKTNNPHLLHREAVDLVIKNLPGAVSVDSIISSDLKSGKGLPYHIDWNGLKLLVRIARPSVKKRTAKWQSSQTKRWYFSLRDEDHKIADFFILFCLTDSEIIGVYAIPRVFSARSLITISRIDGNMRYDYFRTDVQNLHTKIMEVKNSLPKLVKIYREVEGLRRNKNE